MRDWYRDPKSDPDAKEHRERPQRRKKNTRLWCKGVVGREHVPVLEYNHRYRNPCGWAPKWAWRVGKKVWWCHHIVKCGNCGKHLREGWMLRPQECPTYKEQYPWTT